MGIIKKFSYVLGFGVLGLVFTVASLFFNNVELADRKAAADIGFGWPMVWLHQDQTILDFSYPTTTRFLSPWQYVSGINQVGLVVDVLLWSILVGFLILGLVKLVKPRIEIRHSTDA